MAAASGENESIEDMAEEVQPPSPRAEPNSASTFQERKRPTNAASQRVRSVRLTTQVHPELLLPFLYGERGGRSITNIVQSTGCTIDYCALSPDEAERSPESRAFIMNFLVGAATNPQLEDAMKQLRTLVDRLQTHLQKKARPAHGFVREVDARPNEFERVYAPRHREEEKTEFVSPPDAAYRPHFVTRRRVRRYPDHPRWTPRSYPLHPRGDMGYGRYAVPSPDSGTDQTQRLRARQPRHIYQSSHFAQPEFSLYGYEEDVYDGSGDITSENAGVDDPEEFMEIHQPRRSLKRPISSMRSDALPIYRPRVPYIYDYPYEDEEDEWMTEDDEMAYGYPPQYRHMEVPVVHRRRVNSVSSQQWSSPVGRMYKRRRIPREEVSLEHEMIPEPVFEPREQVPRRSNARVQTTLLDQLDDVAERNTADTFHDGDDDDLETAQVSMEDGSTVEIPGNDSYNQQDKDGESLSVSESVQAATSEVMTEPSADVLTGELTTVQEILNLDSDFAQLTDDKAEVDVEMQPGIEMDRLAPSEVALSRLKSPTQEATETTIERDEQNELTSLISASPIYEAANHTPSPRSPAFSSSPARQLPLCSPGGEESRVASPPQSGGNDVSHAADSDGDTAVHCAIVRTECFEAATCLDEENTPTHQPKLPDTAEIDVLKDAVAKDSQPIPLTTQVESPVVTVVTDAIQINNHVIASLEWMNKQEAAFEIAKTSLTAQEAKYRRLERSSKYRHRLEVLCSVVYELQCQIGSHLCSLSQSRKQELLDKLDSYLELLQTESEEALEEKVDALQDELKRLLDVDGLSTGKYGKNGTLLTKATTTASTKSSTSPVPPEGSPDKVDETTNMSWEDGDWFEEAAPIDPTSDSEEIDSFVDHFSSEKSNPKLEGDFLAVKLEQGLPQSWPRELPLFVWSLLARVVSSDPQSYVMRVTQKRLMDEIAKGDPYYYLHPAMVSNDATGSSSNSHLCEFGCRGASALKWERKLVSQISSRMKSFDNVAYSLARSSGGKEVLNRKKMNSIIRKLHLVAMQLHSLVSHLYCVKGQTTCKEVDSLPIALNNSHYERKMGVYKSRLKLVVPHKYQQQPSQQQVNSTSEPAEELLRDTYEFFPELLLCVDIWGYNYREGQAKNSSKSVLDESYSDSGLASGLFPLGFFRGVESLAFDFEHDRNGLLRCICDELLNIVCLWNDFKWTDNLEGVALERVVSFETDVTASILKILEIYAHHLQALWAIRLLDEPEQLGSIHFTQFNAYYSDRSQGSLNSNSSAKVRTPKTSTSGPNTSTNTIDQLVAREFVEQRLAQEYWNRKVTALSIHNHDDDMDIDGATPKPSQLLSIETICSWDQDTLVSYLLRWSDVYAIRGEVNSLSAVTSHMLKHEVQQYELANREAGRNCVDNTMVDTESKQLLAAVSRAQMLIRDALIGAEKLALHLASNQLPDERKCRGYEDEQGGSEAIRTPISDELSFQANASMSGEDLREQVDEAASSESEAALRAVEQPSQSSRDTIVQEESTFEVGSSSEQPELRDLIQLLAVTKQEMQELCGHRPRSARMREKVQTQSLQLARQTVEIFRNIRNMYGSQQRR